MARPSVPGNDQKSELERRLIAKSIEAFILGLEVFNKPTIRYRIEGFSFFICNAWELLLKAKLLNDGKTIYYKDSTDRTLSLRETLSRIYTDKNQPLRQNLEKIATLRDTSTHFVTEDYETVYSPLFQACVINYGRELERFFGQKITDHIAQNFLMLSATIEPLSNEQIELKHPPEIASRLIFQKNDIELTREYVTSDQFSIPVEYNLYLTKKRGEADLTVALNKTADASVRIVKERVNPADTHKYSFGNLVKEVQRRLVKSKIRFTYLSGQEERTVFNSYCLDLFVKHYSLKDDARFAFKHVIGKAEHYTYSQQAAEFIVAEIEKGPAEIIGNLRRAIS